MEKKLHFISQVISVFAERSNDYGLVERAAPSHQTKPQNAFLCGNEAPKIETNHINGCEWH